LSKGSLEKAFCEVLDCPESFICSELAAYALDEQPEYRDKGVLAFPNSAINPQNLFEDNVIFEPWKNEIVDNFKKLVLGD
jgi:hypothetical protein